MHSDTHIKCSLHVAHKEQFIRLYSLVHSKLQHHGLEVGLSAKMREDDLLLC